MNKSFGTCKRQISFLYMNNLTLNAIEKQERFCLHRFGCHIQKVMHVRTSHYRLTMTSGTTLNCEKS